MLTRYRSSAAAVLCVVGLTAAAPLAAQPSAYEMAAYVNAPGGRAVLDGRYADAIEDATRPVALRGSADALGARTTLCVAYTLRREFREAEEACGAAVDLAGRADRRSGTLIRRSEATARALTNRGVLRAVSGDALGAAADFAKAARLDDVEAPQRNLARLERTPAYRLARAQN